MASEIRVNTIQSRSGLGTVTLNDTGLVVDTGLKVSGVTTVGVVTSATSIQATNFYGGGTIPVGGIIMWSGTIANIPTGWALCNGSNGTPDLRSRFIVGAGTDTMNVWGFNATTGAQTFTASQTSVGVGSTGGEVAHQLTIAELAAHNHTYDKTTAPGPGQDQAGTGSGDAVTISSTNTGNTGGDKYHENRPPYYALAFIMRTS